MFGSKTLALCALAATATLSAATTTVKYTYKFDAASAGGVQGDVVVEYASPESKKATISANLDFSKVDLAELQKADGNCTALPTEYAWHIHVKWPSDKTSDKYGECSLAKTGNHYDPLKACGPNSEFAATPECAPKIKDYACNPGNYTKNPLACEKGDLSGKFGKFKPDASQKVSGKWVDENYPLVSENTPQWNVIVHAVCGKNTPRLACALGKKTTHDNC